CAVQEVPRGTGDAVRAALPALDGFDGDVLILLGDMPLLSADTLRDLVAAKGADALAVLAVDFENDPPAFGRIVMNDDGTLQKIVEDKDATTSEKAITICNTGAFCVDADALRLYVPQLTNKNAQGEFYITDLPALAALDGRKTRVKILPFSEDVMGVNSRTDLAAVEAAAQNKYRAAAMNNGATLIDPATVYFAHDTVIGKDVMIEPNVFFGPGVRVGDHVTIHAFSHIEGAVIEAGAHVGPFARLRPGAVIGEKARVGNFVEVKNATLGAGAKANHLAYIGDADIGAGVNFSCGAITVNYDGFEKHRTIVGDGAFVGCNVNLVAPVTVGAGALVAAGSTITKDVPADALAVAREKPLVKEGWAAARRKRKAAS
ncbi:MAG: bifunctional UDP-N-acetylglucosamine diphosphorylase/glucosamine-1-phosphate N-acetyltransferase GlmU, partial [Alphaproteobacteria bacterium]|nr:bifunctional UDP-N-acetylglucosamine diphosphorylase/glucosamine-1-phosphate N-acetyltransferase GlmU [Alphaproteobacteria bacterium]